MFELSPNAVGLIGLAILLVLIFARFPIGLSLAMVSIGGLAYLTGWSTTFSLLSSMPYDFAASWELSAIPMFLLMGAIAFHSGMTSDLYAAARVWLHGLPGGLAVASNFACAGFAAASGSSVATTVAMGRIAVPEMLRLGYDKSLATSTVACAGTLGSLIPPSVLMIVYAIFTQQSVGNLFLAGFIPGVLTAVVYGSMIVIRCHLDPTLAPAVDERPTLADKLTVLWRIWPLPLLIIGVIGSIYGGIATPTEAGRARRRVVNADRRGAGARCRGECCAPASWSRWRRPRRSSSSPSAPSMLTRFMLFSGVPDVLADLVRAWSINLFTLLIVISIIYLVLGCFLDPLGLILITLPVVLPALGPYKVRHDLVRYPAGEIRRDRSDDATGRHECLCHQDHRRR